MNISQHIAPPAEAGWNAGPDCSTVDCKFGKILIEGAILRVENQTGRRALDRLAALIERDGPSAMASAQGDFVAIVAADHAVYGFKSFTSQYQLYYRTSDGAVANRLGFFFDSSHARWNEHYFARHVLMVPGNQFLSAETPLDNVSRVLPGELIRFSPSVTRQQLIRRRYSYRLDASQRREDVAPDILAILRASIKDRLAAKPHAKVCVEISGGLDSSFIACLLGEETSSIRGVMFTQPTLPSHAISQAYAQEVADRYGIDLTILHPEDIPNAVDENPPYSDEPSDFFWFGDWFSRSVAQVAEPGSQVFTGFGADQLFLRAPSFLPYLLQEREYKLFAKALPPASKLLSRGQANLAWQSMLSLVPEKIHQPLNRMFANSGWSPWDVSDVNMRRMLTEPVPWLKCGRSLGAYSREREAQARELVGDGIICDDWGYFSAPRTVTQGHFTAKVLMDASPYCDLPLLDFVYDDVSALLVHDFEGRYKELLRECQKGIVPESLRSRQNDTFVFNSFQMTYVNKAREYFASLLRSAPDGWIDHRAAAYALEQLSFGITNSSTRSVLALMGYLGWRRAFVRHQASTGERSIAGLMSARAASA
jgi:asparagine synthase (glutamine-hydrolysing)